MRPKHNPMRPGMVLPDGDHRQQETFLAHVERFSFFSADLRIGKMDSFC